MDEQVSTLGDTLASDTLDRSQTEAGPASTRSPLDAVVKGSTIGRYLVLGKLGAGAMGVVLAAYDPELDRKVAIKLLTSQGSHVHARAQLQREAQALAKLDHPNVVGVHDVGLHGDRLFVAMDFVEGCTLATWMSTEPRSWRAVVAHFVAAGRGLAAAHQAGLVHRDFKPENVMLGVDGRVRVLDFGLARPAAATREPGSRPDARLGELSQAAATLAAGSEPGTRTGMLVGTPAYMAAEIWDGQPADARSDQFSFCTALYEGLYGERPFAANDVMALLDALANARVRPPPRNSSVPAWLRKVVVRGLAPDPAARWPAMPSLLDALLDDPRVRRRQLAISVGALGLVGSVIAGVFAAAPREPSPCEGLDAPLGGVWDEPRRAALAHAFEASGLDHGGQTWARVEPRIDAYAGAWVRARVDACEAAQRGEQSGATLDRRMACYDERLDHLAARLDELAQPNAKVIERAVEAIVGLPSLERCSDLAALALERATPDDPRLAERVRELEARMIGIAAKHAAGRYEAANTAMDALVRDANALGYEPLQTRAWVLQGRFQDIEGDYEAALATFERAYASATALRMTEEAATAAIWLMYVGGYELGRPDSRDRWDIHARSLVRALGSAELEADYLDTRGALASAEGDYASARVDQERALAILEARLGPDHPTVATFLNSLGIVADMQGDLAFARACHERALGIRVATLGAEHALVGNSLANLGVIDMQTGDYEQARARFQRALDIEELSLGPNHPTLADALQNLALAERALGQLARARVLGERVLAIQVAMRGPDHPLVANALDSLAEVAADEHDLDAARRLRERSLALRERSQGREHPELAGTLLGLAALDRAEHRHADSQSHALRALAIQEAALGPEHPTLELTLTAIGWAYVEGAQPGTALPYLERALALRLAHEGDPNTLAETRFALAQALWDATPQQGRDRARARELAEAAHATWSSPESSWSNERDWIAGWLASHPE